MAWHAPAKRNRVSYGRKVKINVSERTGGMNTPDIPVFEVKGRKTRVGYLLIEWMIENGYLRYSDLLYAALFKDLKAFQKLDGDKEIRIRLVSKNENGEI